MSTTQLRLDTQAKDATLIPSKISTSPTDDFSFPRDVSAGRDLKLTQGNKLYLNGSTNISQTDGSNVEFASTAAFSFHINSVYSWQITDTDASGGVGTAPGDWTMYLPRGTASQPVVFLGDSAGLFTPDGNTLSISTQGTSVASFTTSALTAIGIDVKLSNDKKVIFGNSNNAYIEYDSTNDGIKISRGNQSPVLIYDNATGADFGTIGDELALFADYLGTISGGDTYIRLKASTNTVTIASDNLLLATGNVITEIAHINATGIQLQGSSTIDMGSNKITSMADPTDPQDAATKNYVDSTAGGVVNPGLTGHIAFYPADGDTIDDAATLTTNNTDRVNVVAADISVDNDKKIILGNSDNAYVQYRASGGDTLISTNGSDAFLTSIGQFAIFANTLSDDSGSYYPQMRMGKSGANAQRIALTNADTSALPLDSRSVDIGMTNGYDAGYHPIVRLTDQDTDQATPDIFMTFGYDADGSVRTGSRIRGVNLTVQSLSPLNFVADTHIFTGQINGDTSDQTKAAYRTGNVAGTGITGGVLGVNSIDFLHNGIGVASMNGTDFDISSGSLGFYGSFFGIADSAATVGVGLFGDYSDFVGIAAGGNEVSRFDTTGLTIASGLSLKMLGATLDFSGNGSDGVVTFDGSGFHINGINNTINFDAASGGSIASNSGANQIVVSGSGFPQDAIDLITSTYYVNFNDTTSEIQFSTAASAHIFKVTYGGLVLQNSSTINMGGNKITNLAAATANGDATRFEQTVLTDGSHAITGDQSFSSTAKITNLLDPTLAQDAATKAYVDNAVAGLSWKQAARAASTANVTIATAPAAIDGVTLVSGNRVLLKDQTAPEQNGIYIFNGTGNPLTRSLDANSWAEIVGLVLYIEEGTLNVGSKWVNINVDGGTLDTTPITFTTFASASALDGTGTAGYNAYWTSTSTLAAEQYVAASRGGLATNASAFTGVVKASGGTFSASTIVNADVNAAAAIAESKLALDFSTSSLNTAIGTKVSKAGDTMTGTLNSQSIIPTANTAYDLGQATPFRWRDIYLNGQVKGGGLRPNGGSTSLVALAAQGNDDTGLYFTGGTLHYSKAGADQGELATQTYVDNGFVTLTTDQTIDGQKTFTKDLYVAKQANSSDADIFITSKVGAASPAVGGNLTLSAGDYPGSNQTSQATSGSITITTCGVNSASLPVAQGGGITLTSGSALVNVGGASAEARGGSITLTSGDVNQTFGSGAANKTRGGSITLTSGACVTSGDDLGGNITLTSNTAANGGSVILTGTGAIGTPGSPAKGNIYANHVSLKLGSAASPAYTFDSDTDTGIFSISPNKLGFATNGTQAVLITSVQDVNFSQNINVLSDKNLFLGNAGNAFWKFSTAHNAIVGNTVAAGHLYIASAGDMSLYSNSAADASGDFLPAFHLKTTGEIHLETNLASGTEQVFIEVDRGTSVVGFNPAVHNAFPGSFNVDIGYDSDGSVATGTRIRGNNLTVESLSPLNLVADSVNISSKILNQDGSESAPTYSFASDTAMGMFRDGSQYLAWSVEGATIQWLTTDPGAAARPGNVGALLLNTNIDLVMSGQIQTQALNAAQPDINFGGPQGLGLFHVAAGILGVTTNGVERARFDNGGIKLIDGTESAPSYSFTSDSGSGMWKEGSQYVAFSEEGVAVLAITSTDDVGIGNPGISMGTNMDIAMADGKFLGNGANDPTHPSIAVVANTNGGGLTCPTATDLGLAANGANRAHITSNGIEMQGSSTINMGSNRITNLADPTSLQDAATKNYVDTFATGLSWKLVAKAASTENIDLTTGGEITVDDISVLEGDRVLVKDQTLPEENGIYIVHTGSWTRSLDADSWTELISAAIFVSQGTYGADKGFVSTVDDPGTLGTDPVTFVTFTAAIAAYVGGNAISIIGNNISAKYDDETIGTNGSNELEVKDGGISYVKTQLITRETPAGTVNGSNTVFTLANNVAFGSEHVFLNGVLQDEGGTNDYTLSSDTITFTSAPLTGSKIRVSYWKDTGIVVPPAFSARNSANSGNWLDGGDASGLRALQTDSFILAGWVTLKDTNEGYILTKGEDYNTASDEYSLYVSAGSGVITFNVNTNNTGPSSATVDSTALTVDVPSFVLAWFDSGANTINIQVDNGTVNSNGITRTTNPPTGGNFTMFANDAGDGSIGLNSVLDEWFFCKNPAVMATAISTIQSSIYNGGSGKRFGTVTSGERTTIGLISWWGLDEASNTTRMDLFGSNNLTNNGTITADTAIVA